MSGNFYYQNVVIENVKKKNEKNVRIYALIELNVFNKSNEFNFPSINCFGFELIWISMTHHHNSYSELKFNG